jgi:hypothetical protein
MTPSYKYDPALSAVVERHEADLAALAAAHPTDYGAFFAGAHDACTHVHPDCRVHA